MRSIVLAVAFALSACGGDEEECAGFPACLSGLRVTVTNPPAQAYRVEVLLPGQTTPRVQTCTGGACPVIFPGLVEPQVTVTVVLESSGAVVTSVNASPAYGGQGPTGGPCSFDCRSATVSV